MGIVECIGVMGQALCNLYEAAPSRERAGLFACAAILFALAGMHRDSSALLPISYTQRLRRDAGVSPTRLQSGGGRSRQPKILAETNVDSRACGGQPNLLVMFWEDEEWAARAFTCACAASRHELDREGAAAAHGGGSRPRHMHARWRRACTGRGARSRYAKTAAHARAQEHRIGAAKFGLYARAQRQSA